MQRRTAWLLFFFSSRRRHTRCSRDWSSDVCSSDLVVVNSDFSSTKYSFVKELGRGGMGTVYLAEDTELNRHVAIKVLNTPEVTDDLRNRMIREAQIIARLEHPGIVRSEEHTSELQSRLHLVCRLLL